MVPELGLSDGFCLFSCVPSAWTTFNGLEFISCWRLDNSSRFSFFTSPKRTDGSHKTKRIRAMSLRDTAELFPVITITVIVSQIGF